MSSAGPTDTTQSTGVRTVRFQIYRYDPDRDGRPHMQSFEVRLQPTDRMLLDGLMRIKADYEDRKSVV